MEASIGIDFEDSLGEFEKEYADIAKSVVLADGERIASSQYFYSLSSNEDEIFFITDESGVDEPELIIVDKIMSYISKKRDSWLGGKVIKKGREYFTQASKHVSPTKIYQGLYDGSAYIKDGTESKMIQGYLSSGEEVYFDVPSSYSQAQLYVGKKFYAQVNSSVIIDKDDNLYYFVQKGKERTLYKNKTPLYTYRGFYGIVSDVDVHGGVYFVANSKFGSTLYRYRNSKVSRVSSADNIVEARLINSKKLLIAAVSDKDYYYVISRINSINEEPYETELFFETKEYYGEYHGKNRTLNDYAHVDLNNSYYSLLDMHYSGTDMYFGLSDSGMSGGLNLNFEDPLSQNSATFYASRNDSNISIVGIGYSNSQYLLKYYVSA
jgi:hypothetical protein